ncbi:ring-opening amidohydrolase [Leptolyngbya sp. FACHB-671]|uniref:cyanuric acid amidohydrolase n=1 Tax=Leptolyngbya sp. FACHB-671 TaxID=2692812 RepID=UPI001689F6AE|nr:ring-opening amidohydrolase [Leptolyngbya sp. FACHB-671]MBD2069987.1 ring-opening amidohydrolase [Leptolyngbya sp. FACHB-671]
MHIDLHKIPQASPDDISGLDAIITAGKLKPAEIIAILGKTEGNGCVNDFTRGFATQSLKLYLGRHLEAEAAQQIIYIMSGGTEGVLSPHINVFTRRDDLPNAPKRWGLVMGTQRTRAFSAEEIGSMVMVETVAQSVRAAIQEAGLTPEHVHFVQIKCPLVQSSQKKQIGSTHSSYQSMADSRGASALGVALALGEIQPSQLQPESICRDFSLYSKVASTSAGVELQTCEIFVLGNAAHSTSDLIVGHDVMQHALDSEAVNRVIASTGQLVDQVVNVFAKAEADPSGLVLGRRHTMLDDSDISHTRMARAVVGSVIASVVQDPMVYVSGGSEHQGPPGGGPIAVIATQ